MHGTLANHCCRANEDVALYLNSKPIEYKSVVKTPIWDQLTEIPVNSFLQSVSLTYLKNVVREKIQKSFQDQLSLTPFEKLVAKEIWKVLNKRDDRIFVVMSHWHPSEIGKYVKEPE
jgi:hypothetical protein